MPFDLQPSEIRDLYHYYDAKLLIDKARIRYGTVQILKVEQLFKATECLQQYSEQIVRLENILYDEFKVDSIQAHNLIKDSEKYQETYQMLISYQILWEEATSTLNKLRQEGYQLRKI